jgi:hypothetical protein
MNEFCNTGSSTIAMNGKLTVETRLTNDCCWVGASCSVCSDAISLAELSITDSTQLDRQRTQKELQVRMRMQMLSSFYDFCNNISVLLLAHGESPMPRSEVSLTFTGTFWTVESKLHVLFELIRAILTTENVCSYPLVAGQM